MQYFAAEIKPGVGEASRLRRFWSTTKWTILRSIVVTKFAQGTLFEAFPQMLKESRLLPTVKTVEQWVFTASGAAQLPMQSRREAATTKLPFAAVQSAAL